MPLVFSTDTPAPKRAGLVFSTDAPPARSPSPARTPARSSHQTTPPRPAAAKKKKNNLRGRPKGGTQDVVATRQLLDTRLSSLAGVVGLAQGGCRCGTCEARLQLAYGDPDLPDEVVGSVASDALGIRRAFWPVGVTARAQRLSRIEHMQSAKLWSSRHRSVLLNGCLLGDRRVALCEGEPTPRFAHVAVQPVVWARPPTTSCQRRGADDGPRCHITRCPPMSRRCIRGNRQLPGGHRAKQPAPEAGDVWG